MQEIKPTATETTSIYHTCMSCITQANATDKQLVGIKRFNCSAICPQEIHNTAAWSSPTRYSITAWSVVEQRQPRVWSARRWLCPALCSDSTAVMYCTSK
ncbi:hypothetical protein PF005_g18346 [Phytophthora fragariae]|uniref:Uncharacterized protein n=1 Tax=Phytophthora fragariae TaxID=53985 RepID=A0A6A3YEC5_9STRA|nr:hypothetical protein PF003_g10903 [Phytophthora fragariae]KAE9192737.1 hypothetical protein PF005_g18346 [Phytophthora fragariae]KAE9217338.1 hypothetical protein PF002_g16825 [Phytophthora fragariae]